MTLQKNEKSDQNLGKFSAVNSFESITMIDCERNGHD